MINLWIASWHEDSLREDLDEDESLLSEIIDVFSAESGNPYAT